MRPGEIKVALVKLGYAAEVTSPQGSGKMIIFLPIIDAEKMLKILEAGTPAPDRPLRKSKGFVDAPQELQDALEVAPNDAFVLSLRDQWEENEWLSDLQIERLAEIAAR